MARSNGPHTNCSTPCNLSEPLAYVFDHPLTGPLDGLYRRHRRHLELLVSRVNPRLPAEKVALRATIIAAQIEGLMLFLGAGKPKHPELAGLREEALRMIVSYAASK